MNSWSPFGHEAGELARALLFNHPMKDQTTDSALERNPDEWKTGDEPMTDAQRSYLETLCTKTGEQFNELLSQGRCVQTHR